MIRRPPAIPFRSAALVRAVIGTLACLLLTTGVSSAQCAGDCNADGQPTVGELITMINVALGEAPAFACGAGDANLDDRVTVDEIIAAIGDSLGSCATPAIRRSFDFRSGRLEWAAGFADYSPEMVDQLQLDAGLRSLPQELRLAGPGFLLSGANQSDDLFMFLKRRLATADGIQPAQRYEVEYSIVFASAAQTGCGGIGGSPGESVFLKAGATSVEPEPFLNGEENHFRMNIDKGNQAIDGPDASLVGDVANGLPCDPANAPFVSLRREHRHTATAGAGGELWLLIATDSGFEGTTTLY